MTRIAFAGYKNSGKDTAANLLLGNDIGHYKFTELLRNFTAEVNPYVAEGVRWVDAVDELGYDVAKEEYPDVRDFLRRLSDSLKSRFGPDYIAKATAANIDKDTRSVVVSDLRFPEEEAELKRIGFITVRINVGDRLPPSHNEHNSESSVALLKPDYEIDNSGTLDEFVQNTYETLRDVLSDDLLANLKSHLN